MTCKDALQVAIYCARIDAHGYAEEALLTLADMVFNGDLRPYGEEDTYTVENLTQENGSSHAQ